MRVFLGVFALFASVSAVAVLQAVTGSMSGELQAVSEATTRTCEAGEACEAAHVVLVSHVAPGLSALAADRLPVPPSVAPVHYPEHPYPDHP